MNIEYPLVLVAFSAFLMSRPRRDAVLRGAWMMMAALAALFMLGRGLQKAVPFF